MRTCLVIVVAAVLVACGKQEAEPPRFSHTAPPPGMSAVDRPHVVFTVPEVVLSRIGEPSVMPTTVPSRPSPETLLSDAPHVVSIDDRGRLVAHAAGEATIRTIQGPAGALRVKVVAPRTVTISPSALSLAAGESAVITVLDEQGRSVPDEAIRWESTGPEPLVVRGGRLRAPGKAGAYRLTAKVGLAEATVPLTRQQAALGTLKVFPSSASVRRGRVLVLRAHEGTRPVFAEWLSSDTSAVASLGQGLFQALRPGRARACARLGGLEACSDVEVKP